MSKITAVDFDGAESLGGDTRKIFSDEYRDDKAVRTPCDD